MVKTENRKKEQSVAIVTGASSGIGKATALAFARRKYAVVIAARREDPLEQLRKECEACGAACLAVPTDVSQQEQVEALVEAAVQRFGRVDVMVNNAGYGVHARVHETTADQMRRIFDTNFFGVFYGCKAVAPVMIRQQSGHIFNVSSVIGKRGSPFNGAYSATKFAVCGLTDSMRVEMLEHKVHVTSVCPGLTDTEFFDVVEGGSTHKKTSFARVRGMMAPEVIARKMVATVGRHKPELIFSISGKLLTFLAAISPRFTDVLMRIYYKDQLKASDRAKN